MKFSVSIKFSILTIFLVLLLSFSFILVNYHDQMAYFEKEREDLTENIYGLVMDAYFGDYNNLRNESKVNELINTFMEKNSESVLNLNLLLRENKTDKLLIAASSNKEKIGTVSPYIEKNIECLFSNTYYFKQIGDSYNYLYIEPVYSKEVGGNVGTFELVVTMEKEVTLQHKRNSNILTMSLILLAGILVLLLFVVYVVIQKPISRIKNATAKLGKGDLDTRVNIKAKDEFGELAYTFNNMAKELKESRDKIEEYNKILEKLLNQKDEFIGQLGHDLKNPMQPLVGLLPILIEEETDPKKKKTLEVMNENVEYMQELIFDTLKLAKLRSDNIDFDFEKLNLRNITDKVIISQKTMLEEKNIEIENKINPGITVLADKLRLSEVFKNLINNSVKYTPVSGGKIVINAKNEEETVTVSIKDTGIGMTKEEIKKVFDEFYKADKATSDYHSTGLGLAICKRIVEKHGGKIWVESQGKGKGSTFYFQIKNKEDEVL